MGAVTPAIPLLGHRLGAGHAVSAVIVALLGFGQIIGDVPAGKLAARVGDRWAMLIGGTAGIGVLAVAAVAGHWLVLAGAVLVLGGIGAIFGLARQAYVTRVAPVAVRARALSSLGGVARIGMLIGPFAAAPLEHAFSVRAAFWLAVATSAVTVAVVALLSVPGEGPAETAAPGAIGGQGEGGREAPVSAWAIVKRNRRMLATMGVGIILVGAVRATRNVVLPLWSAEIGLDDATTSIVFGLSGLVDAALFYPSGKVMDRHGRAWVAVPSMAVMGVCLALLPLTGGLGSLAAVAMALGFGNGIGSGIVMTLGADLAPAGYTVQFLAVWRLLHDSGNAGGPLVVSAGAALGSLAAGVWVMAGGGLVAAALLFVCLPRWTVHANHRTRRAAGLE
jgi:MFS family permease